MNEFLEDAAVREESAMKNNKYQKKRAKQSI